MTYIPDTQSYDVQAVDRSRKEWSTAFNFPIESTDFISPVSRLGCKDYC